jgi:carbon-monoxide dehydrogenase large subunit
VRHLGVNDIQMPCTPERVWRAIHAGDAGGADQTTGAAAPHFDESTGTEGQTDRTTGSADSVGGEGADQ